MVKKEQRLAMVPQKIRKREEGKRLPRQERLYTKFEMKSKNA